MKIEKSPTPEDIRELKKRHHLTIKSLAAPIYGVTAKSVENWINGYRPCPPLAWWAIVLHFDGIDLRELDESTVRDRFLRRGELLEKVLRGYPGDVALIAEIQREIWS